MIALLQIQEAAGGERARAEADERAERRLRAAARAHPQPRQRQEAQQVRDTPDGADLHRIAQGTPRPRRTGLDPGDDPIVGCWTQRARHCTH